MRLFVSLALGLLVMLGGSAAASANMMKQVKNLMATPGGNVFFHLNNGDVLHARLDTRSKKLTGARKITRIPQAQLMSMSRDGYLYFTKRDGTLWSLKYDIARKRFTTPRAKKVGSGWRSFKKIVAASDLAAFVLRSSSPLSATSRAHNL